MKKISLIVLSILLVSTFAMALTVTAHTEDNPQSTDLLAGQDMDVGDVLVWNDEDTLYVKYLVTDENWVLTEIHLQVGEALTDFPLTKSGNPIPGKFDYMEYFETADETKEYTIEIPLNSWENGDNLVIAAHAVVTDVSCYQTAVLYGIERYSGEVYGIDVLAGTSWLEFSIPPPPAANSASPNGLAYDPITDRFYYTDYQLGSTPDLLYFWDGTSQTYAGQIGAGTVACADIYNGKYYYIPTATDDLREITFNADGTILSDTKLADISADTHRWQFNGDIAVKDGIVYGWGLCGVSGHGYEFFTYNLNTLDFTWNKPTFQSSLQLAFGSDGVLYGHLSAGNGAFYIVSTVDGFDTMVTPTPIPVVLYTDCASGKICTPTTETAWADGTRFTEKGNWATYFTYTVQGWEPLETLTVFANTGTPTTSDNTLASGETYKIVASGTYNFRSVGASDGYLADAEYALRNDAYGTGWIKGDASPYSSPYNGLDLCSDATVNIDWGPLNEIDHTYSILYTGAGNQLSLFIKDNVYGDNSGYLTVEIYYWG